MLSKAEYHFRHKKNSNAHFNTLLPKLCYFVALYFETNVHSNQNAPFSILLVIQISIFFSICIF